MALVVVSMDLPLALRRRDRLRPCSACVSRRRCRWWRLARHYPAVARGLGMVLVLPPHAEVANAVGAVLGRVSQRVHVAVTRPVRGVFRVFTPTGPRDFDSLTPAIALAQHLAGADALVQALDAGAAHAEVVLSQQDNRVDNDIDGNMFFESRVTAAASGPPLRRAPTVARSNTQDASVAYST
jgi:hypothetical protein